MTTQTRNNLLILGGIVGVWLLCAGLQADNPIANVIFFISLQLAVLGGLLWGSLKVAPIPTDVSFFLLGVAIWIGLNGFLPLVITGSYLFPFLLATILTLLLIALFPQIRALAYVLRGLMRASEGNFEDAIEHYLQAEDISPKQSYIPYLIGQNYLKRRNWEKAESYFNKAVAKSDRSSFQIQAKFALIGAALQQKHYALVEKLLNELSQLSLKKEWQIGLYIYRGHFAALTGELEKSLADLNTAAQLDTNKNYTAAIFELRGHTHFLLGQYQNAIQAFTQALQGMSDNKMASYIGLAVSYYAAGDISSAKHTWQNALLAYPELKNAQKFFFLNYKVSFIEKAEEFMQQMQH